MSDDDRWTVGTMVAVKFDKTTYTSQVTRTMTHTNEDNDEEDPYEDEMI